MYLFSVGVWKEKIPAKNTESESDISMFCLMERYVRIIYVQFEHDLHIVNGHSKGFEREYIEM